MEDRVGGIDMIGFNIKYLLYGDGQVILATSAEELQLMLMLLIATLSDLPTRTPFLWGK